MLHLDHYNLRAPQRIIDALIPFYQKILDFSIGPRPNFATKGSWLYTGEHPILHLTVDESAQPPGKNDHLNHIAFRCSGLETFLSRLTAANVACKDAYIAELDITQLFFFDPAGIRIELSFLHEKKS